MQSKGCRNTRKVPQTSEGSEGTIYIHRGFGRCGCILGRRNGVSGTKREPGA